MKDMDMEKENRKILGKVLLFIIAILIICGIIFFIWFMNKANKIDLLTRDTRQVVEEYEVKFKAFEPSFSEINGIGYDFTQDMIYKDKIYHKRISTYNEYLSYKSRWNDIYSLSKEDFDHYFMVITAIENVSMLGLTIADIKTNSDTLYIELTKYSEDIEYNKNETCISIVIPRTMDRENIIVKRTDSSSENGIEEQTYPYGNEYDEVMQRFNESTENLDKAIFETDFLQYEDLPINTEIKISEAKAKQIAEKGFKEGERIWGKCSVFDSIVISEIYCNNTFMRKWNERDRKYAKRKAYVIKKYEDNYKMCGADVYVDVTTGKIIGAWAFGD